MLAQVLGAKPSKYLWFWRLSFGGTSFGGLLLGGLLLGGLLLGGVVLCSGACQPSEGGKNIAKEKSSYEADLHRICNMQEMSGALSLKPSDQGMHAGIWLSENMETQEAKALSAQLRTLLPKDRSARMNQELKRYGVKKCPLFETWKSVK